MSVSTDRRFWNGDSAVLSGFRTRRVVYCGTDYWPIFCKTHRNSGSLVQEKGWLQAYEAGRPSGSDWTCSGLQVGEWMQLWHRRRGLVTVSTEAAWLLAAT